jgi:hypothetical protein
MKLISISGLIGSGKDTAADRLVTKHGYQRVSFAKPLKDIASTLFGWDRTMLEGGTPDARSRREMVDDWWSEKLDLEVTPRYMLQLLGTEVMRNTLHNDIWVLAAERWLTLQEDDARIVITDARFFNELSMIKSLGGKALGIYRHIPKWLDKFYSVTDSTVRMESGSSFMEVDLSSAAQAKQVRVAGAHALNVIEVKLHQSEWEHLLWNDYDTLIDNTKTLEHLYEQVDSIA